jgi:colanic acid biosynthesis glycosyl transferase WcaI
VFVGAGAKISLLDNVDEAADNVLFLPRQPREKLCEMLNASDVTVISFIDGMLGLSVPSRMYNVMAAGVPIIASADPASELVRELKVSDSGWALGRAEAQEMADLIRSLASSTGSLEVRRKGYNARHAVMERYLSHDATALYRKALR